MTSNSYDPPCLCCYYSDKLCSKEKPVCGQCKHGHIDCYWKHPKCYISDYDLHIQGNRNPRGCVLGANKFTRPHLNIFRGDNIYADMYTDPNYETKDIKHPSPTTMNINSKEKTSVLDEKFDDNSGKETSRSPKNTFAKPTVAHKSKAATDETSHSRLRDIPPVFVRMQRSPNPTKTHTLKHFSGAKLTQEQSTPETPNAFHVTNSTRNSSLPQNIPKAPKLFRKAAESSSFKTTPNQSLLLGSSLNIPKGPRKKIKKTSPFASSAQHKILYPPKKAAQESTSQLILATEFPEKNQLEDNSAAFERLKVEYIERLQNLKSIQKDIESGLRSTRSKKNSSDYLFPKDQRVLCKAREENELAQQLLVELYEEKLKNLYSLGAGPESTSFEADKIDRESKTKLHNDYIDRTFEEIQDTDFENFQETRISDHKTFFHPQGTNDDAGGIPILSDATPNLTECSLDHNTSDEFFSCESEDEGLAVSRAKTGDPSASSTIEMKKTFHCLENDNLLESVNRENNLGMKDSEVTDNSKSSESTEKLEKFRQMLHTGSSKTNLNKKQETGKATDSTMGWYTRILKHEEETRKMKKSSLDYCGNAFASCKDNNNDKYTSSIDSKNILNERLRKKARNNPKRINYLQGATVINSRQTNHKAFKNAQDQVPRKKQEQTPSGDQNMLILYGEDIKTVKSSASFSDLGNENNYHHLTPQFESYSSSQTATKQSLQLLKDQSSDEFKVLERKNHLIDKIIHDGRRSKEIHPMDDKTKALISKFLSPS